MSGNQQMVKSCLECKKVLNKDEEYYKCDSCEGQLHKDCANLSASEAKCMPLQRRLLRLCCTACNQFIIKIPNLILMIENMSQEIKTLKEAICEFTANRSRDSLSVNGASQAEAKKKYSEVVRQAKEVIVVKPKDKRNLTEVKQDLVKTVDPVVLKVDLKMGRNLKDGGVILEFNGTKGKREEIKAHIEKDITDDYEVSIPKRTNPKIKVVNIPSVIERFDIFTR